MTSLGFCIVFPVLCSLVLILKNLKLPSGVVFESANILFGYDYLTYFFVIKIFIGG